MVYASYLCGEIGCFTNIIHFFEAFQVMDDVAEQLQLSYSFFGVQGGAPQIINGL